MRWRSARTFDTDDDAEPACRYLDWRICEGDSLEEALGEGFEEFDGFYAFLMGTRNELAIIRFAFSPFTVWFNLTGQPAMMLPLGRSPEGLPLAIQLVARYGDEATVLRLAAQLEAARAWVERKPALVS